MYVTPSWGFQSTLRSLVCLDEAQCELTFLNCDQKNVLCAALEAATEAIEALCRRTLVLTTFDKLYRPGRTRRIYLDTKPVAIVNGLSWGLQYAGTITNASASNQVATVTMTPVSTTQQSIASIALNSIASGVAAAQIVLLAADYPTIGKLMNAVSAAGNGWQGAVPSAIYSAWPTSRLNYAMGTFGAVNQVLQLQLYDTDLVRYDVDFDRGLIELTQNMPEAYRYGDRSFGVGFGWAWSGATEPRNANVRAQYRAGYAITEADLALGYQPVPGTLKTAAVLTAAAILQSAPLMGPVLSQSVTGRSYTLRNDASIVPREARVLLTREINHRFGAWGTR